MNMVERVSAYMNVLREESNTLGEILATLSISQNQLAMETQEGRRQFKRLIEGWRKERLARISILEDLERGLIVLPNSEQSNQ